MTSNPHSTSQTSEGAGHGRARWWIPVCALAILGLAGAAVVFVMVGGRESEGEISPSGNAKSAEDQVEYQLDEGMCDGFDWAPFEDHGDVHIGEYKTSVDEEDNTNNRSCSALGSAQADRIRVTMFVTDTSEEAFELYDSSGIVESTEVQDSKWEHAKYVYVGEGLYDGDMHLQSGTLVVRVDMSLGGDDPDEADAIEDISLDLAAQAKQISAVS